MADRDKVIAILDDMKLIEYLDDLKQRWDCEKEYEDFADYGVAMGKAFEKRGAKLIKATKRPWGAHVQVGNEKVHIFIKYKGKYMNFAAKLLK